MKENNSIFLRIGAFTGLLAVVLGAFGAHALDDFLTKNGTADIWTTAVEYHIWHTLALLLTTVLPLRPETRRLSELCFSLGILLFSGSLYALALGAPSWIGPVTPVGGLLFILGWGALLFHKSSA